MTDQLPLFPAHDPGGVFTDPELPKAAKPRLGGQNLLVLQRLLEGPATNIELELASGSRRINSRVADVRRYLQNHDGKTVTSEAINTARGVYKYAIAECL